MKQDHKMLSVAQGNFISCTTKIQKPLFRDKSLGSFCALQTLSLQQIKSIGAAAMAAVMHGVAWVCLPDYGAEWVMPYSTL